MSITIMMPFKVEFRKLSDVMIVGPVQAGDAYK